MFARSRNYITVFFPLILDGHTVIQVITGKGNHSFNGKPRIKPAVITFIKKKKYGYGISYFSPMFVEF